MSIIKKTVATILMTLGITETSMATETQEKAINAYNFSFTNSDGTPLKLSQYKGKVLLIVNTASKCGFTPQYAGLEALWEKYKEKGLVVIAVPSNDFGTQEPGSNQEIRQFCEANYNISFPVVNKEHVKGKDTHPFYAWANKQVGMFSSPKWNFHKYLIDRKGNIFTWFIPTTEPDSETVKSEIEKLLSEE